MAPYSSSGIIQAPSSQIDLKKRFLLPRPSVKFLQPLPMGS